MKFTQPRLPYAPDALVPIISQETIEYHYGKHEKAYIDNLNRLLPESGLEELSLEEIINVSSGPLFNNASQAWNHIFYFFQFAPQGQKLPDGKFADKIDETFGSLDEFKKRFEEAGVSLFGSGWVWLSADGEGNLMITQGKNADNPICDGLTPIMVFDVWEHAYYIDYKNQRANYLHNLWSIIDWAVIEQRYSALL